MPQGFQGWGGVRSIPILPRAPYGRGVPTVRTWALKFSLGYIYCSVDDHSSEYVNTSAIGRSPLAPDHFMMPPHPPFSPNPEKRHRYSTSEEVTMGQFGIRCVPHLGSDVSHKLSMAMGRFSLQTTMASIPHQPKGPSTSCHNSNHEGRPQYRKNKSVSFI